MVVLVRCFDETFALALESRIDELKDEGLISAILRNGSWIPVRGKKRRSPAPESRSARMPAPAAVS